MKEGHLCCSYLGGCTGLRGSKWGMVGYGSLYLQLVANVLWLLLQGSVVEIPQKFVACLAKECRGVGVGPEFIQVLSVTTFL